MQIRPSRNYNTCPLSYFFIQLVGEKEVTLIYEWKQLDSLSATAKSMKPLAFYDTINKLPLMPWPDLNTPSCNCSRFPNVGAVLVNHNNPGVYRFNANRLDNSDDCGEEPDKEFDDQDEGDAVVLVLGEKENQKRDDESESEVECFAEKMKLKGCSYHEQFQSTLKSCQRMIASGNVVAVELHLESVNLRDDNAIVAQAKVDGRLQSLCYIPVGKIPKVTAAIEENSNQSIKLDSAQEVHI